MKVYLVRGDNGYEPESYVLGVYATEKEAKARVKDIEKSDDEVLEHVWYDEVTVGEKIFLSNR